VGGSAKVFDHEVGARGSDATRASDHLPIFADFEFGSEEPDGEDVSQARISSLLPNPSGDDAGREEVTIANKTTTPLNLSGWKLRDASSNLFTLSGTIPAGGKLAIVMMSNAMPLTNSGDEITLIDPQGNAQNQVSYTSSQAKPGQVIVFP
jgi:hypothetical protein